MNTEWSLHYTHTHSSSAIILVVNVNKKKGARLNEGLAKSNFVFFFRI